MARQVVPAHERQDTISLNTASMEPTMSPPKLSSQKGLGNGEREGRGENSLVTDYQASTPAPKQLVQKGFCP